MFCRKKLLFKLQYIVLPRNASTDAFPVKSYSHLFFEERVQELLKKLTNINYEKVFRARSFGKARKPPVYKLMTTEELEEEKQKIAKKANYLLQMPPVVDVRKEVTKILSDDPALDGHDIHQAKFVFIDISFDLKREKRTVVVREPHGRLRKCNSDERHRVIQIYDPLPGREYEMPKMFTEEYLNKVLENEEYEFILDRACVQFEPDDPIYHKVTQKTYETINKNYHFDRLHSTRHFGCLAFYLVTNKKIDNMLIDNIKSERIDDAFNLVKLYNIFHPGCQLAKLSGEMNDMDLLEKYIELEAEEKDILELSLRAYVKKKEEMETLETGIQKAHGL